MSLILDGTAGVSGTSGTPPLAASGVTAGSYTTSSITVNASGLVTAAANGSAGLAGVFGQVFTSSGTFTIPAGVTALKVTVVGGGGGAGAATAINTGGGGGGGAAPSGFTNAPVAGRAYGGGAAGNGGSNCNGTIASGFAGIVRLEW
jgi:hypothetical protein